jgi:two-component system OmpR family sensor kinase
MADLTGSGSFWRTLRQLPDRTPLRVKLTAAVLVLVTAALALISVTGIAVLRGYLLNQADQALSAEVSSGQVRGSAVPAQVQNYLVFGQRQPAAYSIQWLASSGPVKQTTNQFSGFRNNGPDYGPAPGPTVKQGASWLNHGFYDPITVGGADGTRWRVVSKTGSLFNPSGSPFTGTIIVGINVTNVYQTIGELSLIDLIISCVLLLALAIVAIAVIRASMRPLTDIEQTAQAIAAGDLTRRVPERDPRTEVGRLGRSLNTMLSHVETAFRARTASEEAARRSEEAARRSAREASRSEERMRRFIADASHELRTPLTAIRGYAEYYRQRGGAGPIGASKLAADLAPGTPAPQDAVIPADGRLAIADLDHMIYRVEQEAKRMGVLVDDLLLLARLDQQRPLDLRTVDLLAIGADALHDARVIAPKRTINLTVGSPQAALVIGDEVGLRQVVGNLMSNAMTHTPEGSPIDITIRVGQLANGRSPAEGEPEVILQVTDHGPGLTADQQEHVFERFYRTDRARSRTAGGTGLGLAIVAAIIDAHHGKVWVDSQPGSGATFGFALPLAPEARSAGDPGN